jgi:hypothetical protein
MLLGQHKTHGRKQLLLQYWDCNHRVHVDLASEMNEMPFDSPIPPCVW